MNPQVYLRVAFQKELQPRGARLGGTDPEKKGDVRHLNYLLDFSSPGRM